MGGDLSVYECLLEEDVMVKKVCVVVVRWVVDVEVLNDVMGLREVDE